MDAPQPLRVPGAAHTPKARPDARPMRLALGAGGLAAFSALAAAIVMPPRPATQAPAVVPQQQTGTTSATGTPLQLVRPIRYVQLSPGETAPPGATVIPATAPTPITMVVTVPAPAQKQAPAPQPITIKTTQSGKVVP